MQFLLWLGEWNGHSLGASRRELANIPPPGPIYETGERVQALRIPYERKALFGREVPGKALGQPRELRIADQNGSSPICSARIEKELERC